MESAIARAPIAAPDADPVTTEVIRHALNSASEQMKRALVRTSFSPLIYEVLDFAAALYDRNYRLLGQAPSLFIFMGTLNYCIEAAVDAVGGPDKLDPGDVLLYNVPYGSGSHPQDGTVIMPVFDDAGEELLGYAAIKAHWLDIGAKDVYCTDTTDVFQEGILFPGVKLYRKGELVDDIHRMVLANSRVPKAVAGDIRAQVVAARTGAREMSRLVAKYGSERFWSSVEHMFDHGERLVRSYFEKIPDGRYAAVGVMDSNGLDDEPVPFEVVVEVAGSDITIDYTGVPDQQLGPINCPLPSTVSASRVAISMLAGGGEAPTEGHFRAVQVKTREGSMFHPLPPAPCYLYAWPTFQAIDAIYDAIAAAVPEAVPARSGGDICCLMWWGRRAGSNETWADGAPHPIGQGAHVRGDGESSLMHVGEPATRFPPAEVWEARNPWLLEKVELMQDSGGPGKHRGGLGADFHFHMLEESYVTSVLERTKTPAFGREGGGAGRANGATIVSADGTRRPMAKETAVLVPRGATVELHCGGGGGYGPPSERDPALVLRDVALGYVSEARARIDYPHAFADGSADAEQE